MNTTALRQTPTHLLSIIPKRTCCQFSRKNKSEDLKRCASDFVKQYSRVFPGDLQRQVELLPVRYGLKKIVLSLPSDGNPVLQYRFRFRNREPVPFKGVLK
jgi:hypothetical protein